MKRVSLAIFFAALLVGGVACNPQTKDVETARSAASVPAAAQEVPMSEHTVALQRPVEIEVYADFACPWCYIGAERMRGILERYQFSERVRVHHRAYMLAPDTPEEGLNIVDNLRRKYGREPGELFANVEAAARSVGLAVDYSKIERTYPTVRAHALVLHAAEKGTQDALRMDVYRAVFVEARNVYDVDVLVELGEKHGFTAQEVRDIVTSEHELDAVRRQARAAASLAQGVPFFVLNEARSFSGAQPEATMVEEIRRAGN